VPQVFSQRFSIRLALVALAILLVSTAAFAQGDGSPPPAAAEGSSSVESEADAGSEEEHLETDRDSFTPATTLVGRGRTMLESSYSYINERDAEDSQSFPELLARVGVMDWLELRLGWNYEVGGSPDGFGEEEEEERRKSETKVIYGVKVAVSEQDEWLPQSALIVHAITPTSGANNATQYVAAFVAGWTLPNAWSLDGSFRYVAANEEGDRFNEFAPSIVLKVPLGEHWNAHAEYFGIVSDDRADDLDTHFLSPGIHYLITPNCEIGTRIGFGLNDDSAHVFANVGLGIRF